MHISYRHMTQQFQTNSTWLNESKKHPIPVTPGLQTASIDKSKNPRCNGTSNAKNLAKFTSQMERNIKISSFSVGYLPGRMGGCCTEICNLANPRWVLGACPCFLFSFLVVPGKKINMYVFGVVKEFGNWCAIIMTYTFSPAFITKRVTKIDLTTPTTRNSSSIPTRVIYKSPITEKWSCS